MLCHTGAVGCTVGCWAAPLLVLPAGPHCLGMGTGPGRCLQGLALAEHISTVVPDPGSLPVQGALKCTAASPVCTTDILPIASAQRVLHSSSGDAFCPRQFWRDGMRCASIPAGRGATGANPLPVLVSLNAPSKAVVPGQMCWVESVAQSVPLPVPHTLTPAAGAAAPTSTDRGSSPCRCPHRGRRGGYPG